MSRIYFDEGGNEVIDDDYSEVPPAPVLTSKERIAKCRGELDALVTETLLAHNYTSLAQLTQYTGEVGEFAREANLLDDWIKENEAKYDALKAELAANPDLVIDVEAFEASLTKFDMNRVPSWIQKRQAVLVLQAKGYLEQLNGIIAQLDEADKLAWETTTKVPRHHPLVLAVQQLAKVSDEVADDWFREAAQL